MDKKKLPFTRAHMLTMEIIGKDAVKVPRDIGGESSEEDTEMTTPDEASTPSKMKDDDEDQENRSPRVKRCKLFNH